MWEMWCLHTGGMGSPFHHAHTHNASSERCSPACCNCGVLGGGDQEVNMIQSNSFISLMKVITAYGEKKAARLTKTNYLQPACKVYKFM